MKYAFDSSPSCREAVHPSALTLIAMALLACGDASSDGGPASQQSPQTVAGAPAPGSSEPAGAFHNVQCAPEVGGVCQNPTDCGPVQSGSAREAASNCGSACLGDADEQACTNNCIIQQTGLTPACTDCYAEIVVCSRELCLPPCLMDPESQACFDCQLANGCRAAFDACSGLPAASAPGGAS